ncbi:cytochrome P450 [Cognatiyoonia sp.]|uniref:cytochrome P450 n=1 Tax=Cognatiyoonia sp. TaxID=2211652 RepID=UPI003F69570B
MQISTQSFLEGHRMSASNKTPIDRQASVFLNRLVIALFDRAAKPPSERSDRLGKLFVLDDADDIERVFNDPITFEKDFSLVSAVGPSRFNMNGIDWINLRAKTQRQYAKAGKPTAVHAYQEIYQEELLRVTNCRPHQLEDALSRAALRCFFSALGVEVDPSILLRHFLELRRMVELLQYRSWIPAADGSSELEEIEIELSSILRKLWQSCQESPPLMNMFKRFSVQGDPFPLETVFTDFLTNMFAGIETTTATLLWMVDCLSRGCDVQQALREDVNAGIDKRLDGFRDETLRLFSPIPFVVRKLAAPSSFRGIRLEAGELIMVSIVSLHRDPKYWTTPLSFRAARPEHTDWTALSKRSFRPFLSGPRSCGGRRIAEMELNIGLRLILKHFLLRNEGPDCAFRYSLAFRPLFSNDLVIERIEAKADV